MGRCVTSKTGAPGEGTPITVLVLPNFFPCHAGILLFRGWIVIAGFFQFIQARDDYALSNLGLRPGNLGCAAGNGFAHDVANLCDLINAHMKASTSGISRGSFSRKRCERQPETMTAWPRMVRVAQLDGFKNGVHAFFLRGVNKGAGVDDDGVGLHAASFVISTPPLSSELSMISASTRFLAQPRKLDRPASGVCWKFSSSHRWRRLAGVLV